jgi:hypothetical protein
MSIKYDPEVDVIWIMFKEGAAIEEIDKEVHGIILDFTARTSTPSSQAKYSTNFIR